MALYIYISKTKKHINIKKRSYTIIWINNNNNYVPCQSEVTSWDKIIIISKLTELLLMTIKRRKTCYICLLPVKANVLFMLLLLIRIYVIKCLFNGHIDCFSLGISKSHKFYKISENVFLLLILGVFNHDNIYYIGNLNKHHQ